MSPLTLGDFWVSAVTLALRCRCRVSNTLRSDAHNTEVGGAEHSWHLVGLAADLHTFPSEASRRECLFRAERMFPYVKDEGDHIHVQGAV